MAAIAILKNVKHDNFGTKQDIKMHNIANSTILASKSNEIACFRF